MFFTLVVLFDVTLASLENYVGKKSIGKRREYVGSDEKYLVEWEAYSDTETIIFELTVATKGFVGFGISPVGGMTGADIIIGGVNPNGAVYFSNRHGIGNEAPQLDDTETWELLEASETVTHTYLKVGRQWNTCSSQDVVIGNSTNNFIWSYGEDDVIAYHGTNRGTSANIILEPPESRIDTSNFQIWRMSHTMVMPTQKTTYWCTMQKSPPMTTKHHIVGFRAILNSPEAIRHKHHFIVHKCRAPEGSTEEGTFETYMGGDGGQCYLSSSVPMNYCESYLFLWAVGGKTVIFPEHVGFPVGPNPSYYLLEVHFDNPNNLVNVSFESGLEIFYTPNLREYDAGTLTSGHATSWSITIPPNSEGHVIVGHCSPSCSSNIPAPGINVFNVMLHSHLAGRKLKLRHYRDGNELPWLAADENYNFDYQQIRFLPEEVKIMPGDQLTYECTYNSMQANGTIIGGLSTTEEMCNTFIYYYPEIDLDVCSSEYPATELLKGFGIEGVRSINIPIIDPMVTAPESMANKSYTEVLNTMIPWEEYRPTFQHHIRYDEHKIICGMAGKFISHSDTIKYVETSVEYTPIDDCANRDTSKQAALQSTMYVAFISVMISLVAWL